MKSYPGGKNGSGTYQEIINKIPPHKTYIELFLGSGAILNNKKPGEFNIGVEINRSTIDKFNYTAGVNLYNMDAFDFIEEKKEYFMQPDTFVYIDPPYPKDSRKDQADIYEYEFTDQQHDLLLYHIKKFKCMVAISTYKNEKYRVSLDKWYLHTFDSMTRGGIATEYLYMNYPTPVTLHDYGFLGKDFTDRQRIKRKIDREIKKLMGLPALERNAIISGITGNIDTSDYAISLSLGLKHRQK